MKFAVIGLDQFGSQLAVQDHEVITDATDGALEELGLHNLNGICVTTGEDLAVSLEIRGATRHFSLTKEYTIVELEAPGFILGKDLARMPLGGKYGINLVTTKRGKEEVAKVFGVPHPEWVFEAGHTFLPFGAEANIQAFPSRG